MSDDSLSKLTRSKQRWAEERKFLTGRHARPENERREVAAFFAEALRPQAADLGGDVGYLSGMTAESVSAKPYPIIRAGDRRKRDD